MTDAPSGSSGLKAERIAFNNNLGWKMPVVSTACLSGPLRLRVQSQSRMRLRIAASIAFLFALVSNGWRLQHHYRAVEPPKRFRTRRSRTLTCVWMRDRASRGGEAEII